MNLESPILLVHGFTGTPASWDPVVDALGEYARAVVRPALLGHEGASGRPYDRSLGFEAEVSRLAEEIRQLARPGLLVGYSLGGRIALRLLTRFPSLFSGAILVGAHPGLETAEERDSRKDADARWIAMLRNHGIERFVAAWELLPLFESQQRLSGSVLESQRGRRLSHDPEGLAISLERLGLAAMPSMWPDLRQIPIPVTWVVGAHDEKFSSLADRAASNMACAEVIRVPGAGHNVPLEAPTAMAELIVRSVERDCSQ